MLDPNQQQNSSDTRNMFMAVALAAVAIVGYEYFMGSGEKPATTVATPQVQENVVVTEGGAMPGAPENLHADKAKIAESIAAEKTEVAPRVAIHSDFLEGSISFKGGRVDELALPHYKTELHGSEMVTLFRSSGDNAHFFDAGWLSPGIKAPDGNTTWQAEGSVLSTNTPLTLSWNNGTGQTFKRVFKLLEDSYGIAVTDSIVNTSQEPVQLTHYAQIHKTGVNHAGGSSLSMYDTERSTFYNFMGPMGVVDDLRVEADYEDLQDVPVKREGTQGWLGITSHYFMAALIPDQLTKQTFLWRHSKAGGRDFYTTVMQPESVSVAPGNGFSYDYTLYAGPKARGELEKMSGHLDEAIDYGWFDVISRPIYWLVMKFYNLVGNFGLAIIFTTIILKIITYPLSYKSYSAMAKMRKIQPRLQQLKERYGDNREQFAIEMMALYREHRVNPLSGCWPTFVQIPIFFAFYKVILISFEFRHAPLALWIEDMAAMDPYFVLPVLMGISMMVQMSLSPTTGDPTQKTMMKVLPVVFTFMFLWFPAGLVLYWLTNNVVTILQQYYVMKKLA